MTRAVTCGGSQRSRFNGSRVNERAETVYVETRSSFQTHLMERQGDRWETSKEGVQCGGIA